MNGALLLVFSAAVQFLGLGSRVSLTVDLVKPSISASSQRDTRGHVPARYSEFAETICVLTHPAIRHDCQDPWLDSQNPSSRPHVPSASPFSKCQIAWSFSIA
jgi:hypothetical protein